ncbi:MAG: MIP/aquaporin family protein [Gaiellaceae bacterium]
MDTWQKYTAEFLGTFILVFGGSVALAGSLGAPAVIVVVAFAFGLALLAGLYAFGEVSGGHFNPAVSLGMLLTGRLPGGELIRYWIAQFAGGILAAIVLWIATSRDTVADTTTVPGIDGSGTAFLIEIVFTAIFVAVILQSTVSGQFGASALLAIPLALVMVHLAAIPFSGSSVNPARTFGPDLIGGEWDGIWIYMIGPPLGAVVAAGVHMFVHSGVTRPEAPAAEVLQERDRPPA